MKFKALLFAALAAVLSLSSCEELGGLVEQGGLPSIKFVDFEEEEINFSADGGERQVSFLANRNWTIEEDANWIEVSPKEGAPSEEAQTVMIKVVKNELDEDDPAAGFDREAEIKFTVGAKSLYLTVTQNGPQGSTEALVVYYNNFDKEKAEKTNDKWQTYLDSYEGWKNATGTGVETVTYEFTSMTARTNSGNGSAGSYSDYKDKGASGMNYLWMGSGKPYFAVKNITLPAGKVNYTISFGTERYLYEATDNTFNWEEFKAYVSIDGTKWSVLTCEFAAGKLPNGRWDLASATIKVPAGTEKLHLYFASDLGSAYALDDIKVEEALSEGVAIDFSAGIVIDPNQGEAGGESDATAIYSNNFDKQAAAEGSKGWPYLDQTDVWMNAAGTGAADVTYASSGVSVRNNSNSDGNYSDYAGSGMNNIFFGKTPYFAINNIALGGATDLTLTFGTEKYSQTAGSVFTNSEYHIWLSADGGAKWVEFTDYTFAGGTTSGRWNVATANFTVPSGTETLSICMQVDVASAYRLDDMKLVASQTAGTTVDFTGAVAKDFSTGGGSVTPPAGEIIDVTVAQFNEKPVSTTVLYRLTGTVGGPINTTYGNFDLIDETGKVYVYGISNWSEYSASFAEGGTVTVVGQRGDYNGKIEVLEAYIESYTAGGETPTPPAGDDTWTAVTVAQFLAAAESAEVWYELTGTITNIVNTTYGNFDLQDETGTVYVYGLTKAKGTSNDKSFASLGLKVGDVVTLRGTRASYKEEPQVGGPAYYVSHVAGEGGDTPEPPVGEPGEFDPQGVTWTLGEKAYDKTSGGTNIQTGKVNGVQVNDMLKLGTSKLVGDATLHVPAGVSKIGFYCVAWSGKTAQVKFSAGGSEIKTIEPKANSGATGNPPYLSITVTESDYFEVDIPAGVTDIKVETLDPNNGRVLFIGLKTVTDIK